MHVSRYRPSTNSGQAFNAAKEYEIDLFIMQELTTAMLWIDDDTAVKQHGQKINGLGLINAELCRLLPEITGDTDNERNH